MMFLFAAFFKLFSLACLFFAGRGLVAILTWDHTMPVVAIFVALLIAAFITSMMGSIMTDVSTKIRRQLVVKGQHS